MARVSMPVPISRLNSLKRAIIGLGYDFIRGNISIGMNPYIGDRIKLRYEKELNDYNRLWFIIEYDTGIGLTNGFIQGDLLIRIIPIRVIG